MNRITACLVLLVPVVAWAAEGSAAGEVPAFDVRPGYRVSLAADGLDEARFLELDDKGTLYVSQPRAGSILALRDENGDGVYEKRQTYISGRPSVHGMCFHDGWLWFTQSGSIHKARGANSDGSAAEVVSVIPEGQLPRGGGHWWRSILVTDDALYTSIGDGGNISIQTDTERQKVWRFNHDGGSKQLFASGLRNTEKLRQRPGTNEVWGCDHGSDNYGAPLGEKKGMQPLTNQQPPCEFNHYQEGKFYGHPFVVGNGIPRLEYTDRDDILELIAKTTPPAWAFGAHWAPNGFTFLTKNRFPDHAGDAIVTFHGSWNSTVKVGYAVDRVLFDKITGKPYGQYRIVSTLADDGDVLARPVDAAEAADGSILFSCDHTHRVYRITPTDASPRGAQ